MGKDRSFLQCPALAVLWALTLGLLAPVEIHADPLEVRVTYEGPGMVDENHGLMVFVFGDDNFSDPANPIIGTRYLTANGTTALFTDLGTDPVWLMAVYDEKGGYSVGPLPGPFGLYSDSPGGPPASVQPGGSAVELRFADSNRVPVPPETKPSASFETLAGAEGGIVEIRIYKIFPDLREEFIRFFEAGLEAQAAAGLRIPGQFRSLDEENTFVWMRAFRNQKERQERSRDFYLSPEWMGKRRADAVRLIESAEVMLLEPTLRSMIR